MNRLYGHKSKETRAAQPSEAACKRCKKRKTTTKGPSKGTKSASTSWCFG
ncbi:DUF1660 family phage protein [Algicola sagamiensis]